MTNKLKLPPLALHWLLMVPGVFPLAQRVGTYFSHLWEERNPLLGLAVWAGVPAPSKLESIIQYGVALLALGGIALAIGFHITRRGASPAAPYPRWFAVYATVTFALAMAAWFWNTNELFVGWFLAVLLYPLVLLSESRYRHGVRIASTVLLVGLMGYGGWLLYANSTVGALRITNDYRAFPEYTILESGEVVENREFLRSHRVSGVYEVSSCDTASKGAGGTQDISCLPLRNRFTNPLDPLLIFSPGDGIWYDYERGTLGATERLNSLQTYYGALISGYRFDSPEFLVFAAGAEQAARAAAVTSEIAENRNRDSRGPSEEIGAVQSDRKRAGSRATIEETGAKFGVRKTSYIPSDVQDFVNRNLLELAAQDHLGRFFHHHAFVYLPILEILASPERRTVPPQYGEGLTQTLAFVLKGRNGLPTFNDYYTLYWLLVAVYILVLTLGVWWVTRAAWTVAVVPALALATFMVIGGEAMRMAPGFNPMRHLPDILVFAVLAAHRQYGGVLFSVLRALVLAAFIWWNREFGLFLFAAVMAWSLFEWINDRAPRMLFQVGLDLAAGLLALVLTPSIPSELAVYNLIGIHTPPTTWAHVFSWALFWAAVIGVVFWLRFGPQSAAAGSAANRGLLDLAGIGFLYAAAASIYPVWNPSPTHASVIWLCAVPSMLFLAAWLSRTHEGSAVLARGIGAGYVTFVAAVLLASSIAAELPALWRMDQIFAQHRVFDWKFPGFQAQSTGDPTDLQGAVSLIVRHQPTGRPLMLTRYESLLQVVAQRPGALPYVDLPTALQSRDFTEQVVGRIRELRPAVLFVDADIGSNHEGEVPRNDYKRREVTTQKVAAHAVLAAVFRSVQDCYRPGERAGLLQVWHYSCQGNTPTRKPT